MAGNRKLNFYLNSGSRLFALAATYPILVRDEAFLLRYFIGVVLAPTSLKSLLSLPCH